MENFIKENVKIAGGVPGGNCGPVQKEKHKKKEIRGKRSASLFIVLDTDIFYLLSGCFE